ncbi:tRNA pseudouridine(55) synthase TruB [Prochlorococcus marinus]|uniref:tRNA pseudouridine(55) synthase TruB n=1 Tax=Prochlorococcus marinus TaxID=1219 RepID=UPI0022B57D11|nr:tRNA pseudouridine(55) synthase TruB [Prochlorococcus marinus]
MGNHKQRSLMGINNFGFLIIDKPKGLTSHDCVNRLRKIYGIKKIGHGGTLDPAVTGVLPIAIGNATKLLRFLPSSKKYEGTIQLGTKTNTDDLEGRIISKKRWPKLEINDLDNFLNKFRGSIKQYPPSFSSVNISGERAYKKARRGELFDLPAKQITFYKIEITNWNQETGQIDLQVNCSAGTYLRSLARDIGEGLGCGGSLATLRRIEALGFNVNQSISLPELQEKEEIEKPSLINPLNALDHLPYFRLRSYQEMVLWCTGQKLIIEGQRIMNSKNYIKNNKDFSENFVLVLNGQDYLFGIAKWSSDQSFIQPKIVFNATS